MKKNLIVILMTVLAFNANAQKDTKQLSFGFGIEGGIVTGKVKDIYTATGGVTGRASYKLGPGFATLTTGVLILTPKKFEGEDLNAGVVIPVKAGYKYLINDRFFVMGELGYSTLKIYENYGGSGSLYSYSESGFTYAPTVGVQFGTFEVGLRYESTALKGVTMSAALVRLGWNF